MSDQNSASTPIQLLRHSPTAQTESPDIVATEEPLEIRLLRPSHPHPEPIAITMRTPGHDQDLAAGFLFSENIITSPTEISHISPPRLQLSGQPSNTIDITLTTDAPPLKRNFYINSSCGVCGKASIQALHAALPKSITPPPQLQIPAHIISALPQTLRQSQPIFNQTGGLHAAALFSPTGELQLLREDVGRHNALDKLIGHLLLHNQLPAQNSILLLSGRTSFELIQKAAMANIQLIAAVGAPSSLAISTAHASHITLLGFLRNSHFNIYTHPQRILP